MANQAERDADNGARPSTGGSAMRVERFSIIKSSCQLCYFILFVSVDIYPSSQCIDLQCK